MAFTSLACKFICRPVDALNKVHQTVGFRARSRALPCYARATTVHCKFRRLHPLNPHQRWRLKYGGVEGTKRWGPGGSSVATLWSRSVGSCVRCTPTLLLRECRNSLPRSCAGWMSRAARAQEEMSRRHDDLVKGQKPNARRREAASIIG